MSAAQASCAARSVCTQFPWGGLAGGSCFVIVSLLGKLIGAYLTQGCLICEAFLKLYVHIMQGCVQKCKVKN